LEKYLPTLQLKKSLLQQQITITQIEKAKLKDKMHKEQEEIKRFSSLLICREDYDPFYYAEVRHLEKSYENIAGVELPQFEKIVFQQADYLLFDTPVWLDQAIIQLRKLVDTKERISVLREKQRALRKELKEVSIRVNLFEKMLIPQTKDNIRVIKVFLEDQQLAAVSQAKVAKMKIEKKKAEYDYQR
jgi:V/A-type H+-transporting ATPase subunit D